MTLFYPRQPGTGVLAYLFRLAFASGMAASIVLGFTAIRRRDIRRSPGVDDACVRPRPGRRHAGVHQGHRPRPLRQQRAHPRPEPRGGLDHQPGRRRVRHPPAGTHPGDPAPPTGRSPRSGPDDAPSATAGAVGLPAADRRAPGPALVVLVRRPHLQPRGRRDHHPGRTPSQTRRSSTGCSPRSETSASLSFPSRSSRWPSPIGRHERERRRATTVEGPRRRPRSVCTSRVPVRALRPASTDRPRHCSTLRRMSRADSPSRSVRGWQATGLVAMLV